MITRSQQVANSLAENPPPRDHYAFFFNGLTIRRLGNVRDSADADIVLRNNGLTATYISMAELRDTGEVFYVAHR